MWSLIIFIASGLIVSEGGFREDHRCEQDGKNLRSLVEHMVEEIAERTNCIVFVTDSVYRTLMDSKLIRSLPYLSKYEIVLRDNEEFSRPRKRTHKMLAGSKAAGCSAYVILIPNALLVSEFLQYAERERLINTRGLFLLLHDHRLFRPQLRYLWNRIVNVIFLRRYNAYKYRSGERTSEERIDLDTLGFPPRRRSITATSYRDTWYRGKLRYGSSHFTDKTSNVHGRALRVAVFEHIPAVTKNSRAYYAQKPNGSTGALGIEFELIRIIAEAMNFKPAYYMPRNIIAEKWGTEGENETFTGLLGEAVKQRAAFYLGDLHYTLHRLKNYDLTIPYNTECLTFLTPESLTENSWMLLILPFKLYTWVALLLTLLIGGASFYFLSVSYKKYAVLYNRKIKGRPLDTRKQAVGLYIFTEIQNSILYAYGMLLQVSLPVLPNPWAVRILIGWWWIYSILLAVAYRASMTATLANPVARVTIDTLTELAKSSVEVGGWNEESRNFFLTSSDSSSQEIGSKFHLVDEEDEAIQRVANGSFSYYENAYLLRHTRVKRQVLEMEQQENITQKDDAIKYNLHIMEECAINMPVALGMDKNSPLKPHVDKWIRRIIEVGLVEKWLSDVMEWSKITEIRQESESEKALVNLHKLQGAFVAVAVGYFLAFLTLIGEIVYWRCVVLKDPNYDKYHLDVFYNTAGSSA